MTIKVDDQISLYPPSEDFAEPLFRLLQEQPPVACSGYYRVKKLLSPADTRRLLWETARFNQGGQHFITYIFYENKLAGSIGLVRIGRPNMEGEVGYWISRKYQGLGIITRSCRRLIRYAFGKLGLNRVVIRIPCNNKKSMAVAHRLGFIHEGTLRQAIQLDGSFHNAELFSLLKKDFQ